MNGIKPLLVTGAIVAAVLGRGAIPASADYGPGQQYQIELSANIPQPSGRRCLAVDRAQPRRDRELRRL